MKLKEVRLMPRLLRRHRCLTTALTVLNLASYYVLSAAVASPKLGEWGIDLTGMDQSVKPGDDSYSYVNGTWHAEAEIPADKVEGDPTSELQELAFDQRKLLLEEMAADASAPEGSDRQKIGDWYATLLDEDKLFSLGLAPLEAHIGIVIRPFRIHQVIGQSRL